MRTSVWILAGLFMACGNMGCGNEEKQRAKLAEVEKAAEAKVAQAELQARNKAADAQKEFDALKAELDQTKAKLAESEKAQADFEELGKQAEAALGKAREAFKAEGRVKLADLNKDLTQVSKALTKLPAAKKAELNKIFQKIPPQQKAIAKDIAAYGTATLDTLSATRSTLEKDLALMRANVALAKAKVK